MSNIGGCTRLKCDPCRIKQQTRESQSPYKYTTFANKYENCNKCTHDNAFYTPFSTEIIDKESELRLLHLTGSKCSVHKHQKGDSRSMTPIVMPPEACPIVYDNVRRQSTKVPVYDGVPLLRSMPCSFRKE